MKYSKSVMFTLAGLSVSVLFPLNASANSDKLKWSKNGHYYQRIDKSITWSSAQDECKSSGGHLATITSADEQAFFSDNIMVGTGYYSYYAVGGTDANNGNWRWVTGEKWNFTNWSSSEPDNNAGEDYLSIYYSSSGLWADSFGTDILGGYICEWSYDTHIAAATVPDFNNDGVEESASLYVHKFNTKYYVRLRNTKSGALIGKQNILFGSTNTTKPIAVAGLKDIKDNKRNNKPEIAVLAYNYSKDSSFVAVRDSATGDLLKTINVFGTGYEPKDITVLPDMNNNGSDEISVMATQAGKNVVKIIDSLTGKPVTQFKM